MICAVVLRYWAERNTNIGPIVNDLRGGSVAPAEIMVLDQGPTEFIPPHDVTYVKLSRNFGSRAKFYAALLMPADAYLFVDDDVTVGPETLAVMADALEPGTIVAHRGIQGDWPGRHMDSRNGDAGPIDWVMGQLMLVPREIVARYAVAEPAFRDGLNVEDLWGEDILLAGLAERRVIPPGLLMHASVRDLSDGDVGLWRRNDVGSARERSMQRVREMAL